MRKNNGGVSKKNIKDFLIMWSRGYLVLALSPRHTSMQNVICTGDSYVLP